MSSHGELSEAFFRRESKLDPAFEAAQEIIRKQHLTPKGNTLSLSVYLANICLGDMNAEQQAALVAQIQDEFHRRWGAWEPEQKELPQNSESEATVSRHFSTDVHVPVLKNLPIVTSNAAGLTEEEAAALEEDARNFNADLRNLARATIHFAVHPIPDPKAVLDNIAENPLAETLTSSGALPEDLGGIPPGMPTRTLIDEPYATHRFSVRMETPFQQFHRVAREALNAALGVPIVQSLRAAAAPSPPE